RKERHAKRQQRQAAQLAAQLAAAMAAAGQYAGGEGMALGQERKPVTYTFGACMLVDLLWLCGV
ncbi:unnamed protein product, partial [Closterium sp. NIES-53]